MAIISALILGLGAYSYGIYKDLEAGRNEIANPRKDVVFLERLFTFPVLF